MVLAIGDLAGATFVTLRAARANCVAVAASSVTNVATGKVGRLF